MFDLTTLAPTLVDAGLGWALTAALLVLLAPIVAATMVLTWHGLRGTKPGPAAAMLLQLVAMLLPRGRR